MTGPQQPGDWHLHDHEAPARRQSELDPQDFGADPVMAAPANRSPGRRPLTTRGRSWMLFVVAGCLALVYMSIWLTYSDTHIRDRFDQLPPGQSSAPSVDQGQARVHKMFVTERIDDPGDPDDPYIAEAGTVFVVADVEVLPLSEETLGVCEARLVVKGPRLIELASGIYLDDTEVPTSCSTDELEQGRPFRFRAIYTVPTAFADEIYGVAYKYTDYGSPYQVLRPPA